MKIDLHCHSTCSDGTYAPTEVVQRAHAAGIEVLALTDHDTLLGIDEASIAANACGMQLINGVEISCEHTLSGGYGKNKSTNKIIHVLGLDFSDRQQMHETLQQLQDSRASRGQRITEKLSELLAIDYDELWQQVCVKAGNNPQAVGRAHIGQVLYERGEVKTVQKAFDKYLADNKPAYVPIEALSMERGIELIQACGGKAVLAHPTRYHLSATRVRKLISEFAALGGEACELPANSEPLSTRRMVDRSIEEHQLAASIGSDFHGSNMPWRRLGDVPKLEANQRGIWQSFKHTL
ncbi:PHP domain-containing protein [Psychrobacter sp. AH5]|uniref:PHP domain-containing protein n=1 Tax=Psychrobacter sp. AH5 TaxID=2937433 RepID=UPI0033416072